MITAGYEILASAPGKPVQPDTLLRRALGSGRILVGGGILGLVLLLCVGTLPLTLRESSSLHYDAQDPSVTRIAPRSDGLALWFGTDMHGRSLLGRCLLGGAISLAIGITAAAIAVALGVGVGLLAGYRGGWVDSLLMRMVDVL